MALLREISLRYQFTEVDCDITGRKMSNPFDVAEAFDYLKFETKMLFIIVALNNQLEVLSFETVALGSVNAFRVRPIEVFRSAIVLNATSVIAINNHPSGSLKASREEIEITKKLLQIGDLLEIRVIDHVIIAEDGHNSIKNLLKVETAVLGK